VIDDDEAHAEALADGLSVEGYSCVIANSGEQGLARMRDDDFDVVLTDLVMHDRSGLDVLKEARVLLPDVPVLLITGHATIKTAVDAMREGAEDYLPKPVDIAELRSKVARAVEKTRLKRSNAELVRQNLELRRQIDKRYGFEGIRGHSPQMHRVFEILGQVSSSNATILILGESGTGKELVARAIHTNSPRAKKNFVAVNCAALSEGLIESELFGHVRGAFTGAVTDKQGRIVHADGGTLFLDEVGDMPLATQAKLLRVLETREVTPVGGNKVQRVDIRLVAATNRDLRRWWAKAVFRGTSPLPPAGVTIQLPPMRERAGDIPLLIDHFIGELALLHHRAVRGVTPGARAPRALRLARQRARAAQRHREHGVARARRPPRGRRRPRECQAGLDRPRHGGRRARPRRPFARRDRARGDRGEPQAHGRQPRQDRQGPRHRRANALQEDQGIRDLSRARRFTRRSRRGSRS
jgi:two-component system response regulator HydG